MGGLYSWGNTVWFVLVYWILGGLNTELCSFWYTLVQGPSTAGLPSLVWTCTWPWWECILLYLMNSTFLLWDGILFFPSISPFTYHFSFNDRLSCRRPSHSQNLIQKHTPIQVFSIFHFDGSFWWFWWFHLTRVIMNVVHVIECTWKVHDLSVCLAFYKCKRHLLGKFMIFLQFKQWGIMNLTDITFQNRLPSIIQSNNHELCPMNFVCLSRGKIATFY